MCVYNNNTYNIQRITDYSNKFPIANNRAY